MEGANSSSMLPSMQDLFLVLPRLAQKAGSFGAGLFHMPEAMEGIAGTILNGGSITADAIAQHTTANSTTTDTSIAFAQNTASTIEATMREAWRNAAEEESKSIFMSIAQGVGKLKQFGGIFSYLTSKWALTTFTAVSDPLEFDYMLSYLICATARQSFSIAPTSTHRRARTSDCGSTCDSFCTQYPSSYS